MVEYTYEELLEQNRKQALEIAKLLKENGKLLAERNKLFKKVADVMEILSDD